MWCSSFMCCILQLLLIAGRRFAIISFEISVFFNFYMDISDDIKYCNSGIINQPNLAVNLIIGSNFLWGK
eukprot:UN08464